MSTINAPRRGLDLTFGTSFLTTMAVAVAPSFVSFGFLVWSRPDPHPVLATIVAVIATAMAFVIGSKVWENQPESYGFSFADLMLWHWIRREWAEEKLIRNARMLGYDRQGRFVGKVEISRERQLFAAREIGAALDAKSSYTLNHSKRVEKHAREMAAELGLSTDATEELATAAALHDIGNIRIPEHVIRKAGELTLEERSTIEGHVLLGALMAFEAGGEAVVQGLRHHHERWDGKGYPNGLKGEEIPLFARIIGIAEAYDAMTSTRPYRQSLTQEQAIAVLRDEGGTQFDPTLVESFALTLPEPIQIVERVPALAWAQRQLRELSILFRRVGGTAVSAAASTLAIALILGTALLKPDVFSGGGDGSGGPRPERRMIAGGTGQSDTTRDRISLTAVSDEGVSGGETTVVAEEFAAAAGSSLDEVEVLGERIRVDGHDGGGHIDPGAGKGGGGGNDGNGGAGNGGTTDPDPTDGTPDIDTDPDVTDPGGGGSGGGGTNPPPVTPPGPTRPGNGNGNGNGHTKPDKGNGHGYGKDKEKGGKPDNPGNGNGGGNGKPDKEVGRPSWAGVGKGSGGGNGHGKPDSDSDSPGSNAGGNAGGSDKGNGNDKNDGWAESGNGNGNGNAGGSSDNGNDNPNSGGGSDAGNSGGGNSDSSPGNSDNSGSDSGSDTSNGNGNGNGSDKSDSPGNSGSAGSSDSDSSPGNSGGNGNGNGSGGSSSSEESNGNSGNSNGGGRDSASSDTGV